MAIKQSAHYNDLLPIACDVLTEPLPSSEAARELNAARQELWRRQEWHGWFRWRMCRKGFDWSKPLWLGLLIGGFAALSWYGYATGRLFVTAGGVVFWFTLINLGGFTYFGLTLPGPPLAIPGPFAPGNKLRARIGIYPAGYERRKLARVWVRIGSGQENCRLFELPFENLPVELAQLMKDQETWRIQRGDAPSTEAIVETLTVTRDQIDSGEPPLRVIAFKWNDQILEPFGRPKT